MNRKLFLLLCALLTMIGVQAQTDVTSTYITNPSFEADGNMTASNGTNPNMIQPTGWTQEQTTPGSYQNNQIRDAETDNASNFGKRVPPSDGSYYLFYRHGWNGSNHATFTSTSTSLPAGIYTLSVDYKMVSASDNETNNDNTAITLSAVSGETTLSTTTAKGAVQANNKATPSTFTETSWKTVITTFMLTEETSMKFVIDLLACGPQRSDFVVDNVRLLRAPLHNIPTEYSEPGNGDFYIVNAATGMPLGTVKNGWGTQAGLAEHGIPFTVTVGSGTYTLNSHTYNSATDYFFNGAYVDGVSTNLYIAPLGNGKYSISTENGSEYVTAKSNNYVVDNTATTASSAYAQWYFVSKENYVSALASATEANPVDATFYIQDPDFSRNHILQLLQNGKSTLNPGSETYLWKYTVSNYHFKGGENGNMCAETYRNDGGKIYQELTGIQNGKYLLKAQAFRSGDGATTLYANNESVGVAEINAKGEGTAASMAGASASFSTGYYKNQLDVFVTDGNLTIGIVNSSSNWACFDNFELYYLGPTIGGEAESLPETAMAAGKWYYFDIPVDGTYNLNTTTLSDIVYTQNGNILIENEGDVTATFPKAAGLELTAGRYYVKSSSAQVLRVIAGAYVYNVGAASLSSADGSYTQSQTFTVTFPDAASNDPDAVAALVVDSKATVNGAEVALTAVSGGFSLEISALTANSNYVINIPAGVYGYAGESMNEAINVTLHTPATFDGAYYLYDATNKLFLGRGANYGARAVADKYGIAMNVATNASGISTFTFVDGGNNKLFDASDGNLYTDNTTYPNFAIESTVGGYYVVNKNATASSTYDGKLYIDGESNVIVSTTNSTVWSLLTDAERDAIVDAYPTDNINTVIAAAGISTTAAEFESFLATNYNETDKTELIGTAKFTDSAGNWTWTQVRGQDGQPAYGTDFAELWNATGTYSQTISNLPAGIYKLTVDGFERRATTEISNEIGGAGYNLVSSYLAANDEQVRLTDWYTTSKPGNTGGAVTAFDNGEATNELYIYLDGNTDLNIKLVKPNYVWDCWTIFNNFTLTCYTPKSVSATIGATGWTTFASAYPLDLGGMSASTGEVKAYYASSVGTGKIVMTSTTSEGVAAGTGLMLKGTAGATITIPVAISGTGIVGNMLVGCTTETPVAASETCYVLINNGGTAEFQSLKTNGATIPAGKAYLNTGVNSPARLIISFDEEDPTAINAVEAAEAETGALKDGKYLVGNKIVLVKNGVKYDANGKKLN